MVRSVSGVLRPFPSSVPAGEGVHCEGGKGGGGSQLSAVPGLGDL